MSIASEIIRLQSAKSNIRTEIEAKGVTVPSAITLDQYPSYIASIPKDYGSLILTKTITAYSNSSITLLGKYAFNDCLQLRTIDCPNVSTISSYAFTGCNRLSTITLSSLYDNVKDGTFAWCSNLSEIPNASKITNVGGAAFYNCWGITEVNLSLCTSIGNGVPWMVGNNISVGAFHSCKNLTSLISLPVCTYIGSYAFFDTGITSLDMSTMMPSVTDIGNSAFANCKSLVTVNFNGLLSDIPMYAFANCKSLANISFGTSVNYIGSYAFGSCRYLESVSFPSSLLSIYPNAFNRCITLETVYIPSDVSRIITLGNSNVFSNTKLSGTGAIGTIYVPSAWLTSYKAADMWSRYSARMIGY